METVAITIGSSIIASISSDVYNVIKKEVKSTYFSKVLDDLDMKVDLEIICALMKDINDSKKSRNAIQLCLTNIHNTVKEINKEIETINLKHVEQHYSNFYLWSSQPDIEPNIKNLKRMKSILDKRFDMLIKLLQI